MEQLEHYIQGIVHVDWLTTALAAAVILAVTAVFARLTVRFMRKMLHYNEEKNLPSSSIFVNIARGAVWLLGVCIMLSTCYGVDVSAAITALGIGGIAISLGFQDTLSNLIGGLQVSLLRIIKPGDNIEVGSSTGVVKDITWRHTTIRNGAGEEVLIPNSIISKTALTHLPPTNQVSLAIVVTTEGQHLDEVAEAIERKAGEAAAGIGKVVKQPKLTFSEITAQGYAGSISFSMADSRTTGRAIDAVLRAVAPLTRMAAPDRAEQVLEEAQQEAEEAAAQEAAGHAPTKPKPKPKPTPKQKQRPSFRKRMARALRLGKEEQS
mgnify:CR=1 FL=1